uniref:Rab-GAP TBC domain-containing protein n=1 Tax=Romanomermis culicivorax TaxID=13658 RepID=A0A915IGJ3_ROMCU
MEKSTPEEFARWHDMVLPDGVVTSTGSYPPPPPAESPDEESAQQNTILNPEEQQSKQSKKRQLENGQLNNNTSSNGGGACLFSVDLGQMRSFRLFYSNQECTCGQLVIASLNARYKILHFHNGGLDKLSQILEQWNAVRAKSKKGNDSPLISTSLQCHQFAVLKPQISKSEQHPEEGLYEKVAWDFWRSCTNPDGQIEDDLSLRKAIFFGGLDQTLRKEAWPFLLNVYPWNSTFEQRDQIRNDLFLEYQNIRKKRLKGALKMGAKAWTYVETTVAKDVVRTDRKNPFFTGENNPNLEKMRNILLNYAAFCPQIGYVQGMSDLLAAVLIVLNEESDAFWCFAGLIQRSIFVEAPKNDTNMKLNIEYLRYLIKLMSPTFYDHLATCQDGLDLLFVHRWILLCFKREFVADDAMRIWESCWSNYQTSYFHLFVCLAIVSVYGEDVVQQKLPYDEILLYFSSLAMHMNVDVVLRKARGLLYRFERRDKIPCTLANVCQWQRTGMWDGTGGQQPEIECAGNHEDMDACPYMTTNDI